MTTQTAYGNTPVRVDEIDRETDIRNTPVALGPTNSDIMKTPVACTLDSDFNGNQELLTLRLTKNRISTANGAAALVRENESNPHTVGNMIQFDNQSTATYSENPEVAVLKQDLGGNEREIEPPFSLFQPRTWRRSEKLIAAGFLILLIVAAIVAIVLSQTIKTSNPDSSTTPTATPAATPVLTTASTNLIINGDFPDVKCFSQNMGNGSACLNTTLLFTPWSVTPAVVSDIDVYNLTFLGSKMPNVGIDLNYRSTSPPLVIEQRVPTTTGSTYRVSFSATDYLEGLRFTVKTGFVTASGGSNQTFTVPTESISVIVINYQFTASSSVSTITLGSTTEGCCGPIVSNISMFAI